MIPRSLWFKNVSNNDVSQFDLIWQDGIETADSTKAALRNVVLKLLGSRKLISPIEATWILNRAFISFEDLEKRLNSRTVKVESKNKKKKSALQTKTIVDIPSKPSRPQLLMKEEWSVFGIILSKVWTKLTLGKTQWAEVLTKPSRLDAFIKNLRNSYATKEKIRRRLGKFTTARLNAIRNQTGKAKLAKKDVDLDLIRSHLNSIINGKQYIVFRQEMANVLGEHYWLAYEDVKTTNEWGQAVNALRTLYTTITKKAQADEEMKVEKAKISAHRRYNKLGQTIDEQSYILYKLAYALKYVWDSNKAAYSSTSSLNSWHCTVTLDPSNPNSVYSLPDIVKELSEAKSFEAIEGSIKEACTNVFIYGLLQDQFSMFIGKDMEKEYQSLIILVNKIKAIGRELSKTTETLGQFGKIMNSLLDEVKNLRQELFDASPFALITSNRRGGYTYHS
jgi:hypothetical protein